MVVVLMLVLLVVLLVVMAVVVVFWGELFAETCCAINIWLLIVLSTESTNLSSEKVVQVQTLSY